MKQSRNKIVIEDFGLSRTIRKRINDLVSLQLTPSTINLFTSEFSKMDEDAKIAIGQFIAALLEAENALLQEHFDELKEFNTFGNSRDHLIMEQRKTNLQRIQQVFIKGLKDQELLKNNNAIAKESEKHNDIANLDMKQIMVTNSNTLTLEQITKLMHSEIGKIRRNQELFEFEAAQLKKSIELAKAEKNEKKIRHLEGQFILTKKEFSERHNEYLIQFNKLKQQETVSRFEEEQKNNKNKPVDMYRQNTRDSRQNEKNLNPISKIPKKVLVDKTVEMNSSDVYLKTEETKSEKEKFFLNIIKEAEAMHVTLEQATQANDPFLMLIAQDGDESGDVLSKNKRQANKNTLKTKNKTQSRKS